MRAVFGPPVSLNGESLNSKEPFPPLFEATKVQVGLREENGETGPTRGLPARHPKF